MGNYDQMAACVNELSGGKNVVLMDDIGLPSIYYAVNQLKCSDLVLEGGSQNIHPAFMVDGVQKKRFLYSKYQNIIKRDRAYSLAHRDPKTSLNWDAARKACENKGPGFHLSTMAERSCIALWCKRNGTMPRGNNYWGCDVDYRYEKGEPTCYEASSHESHPNEPARCFTGSGPATWGHDWTKWGIQDLNGNVWEWDAGYRIVDGEIQIIPYNNAAMGSECDMSVSSTLWKAIKADGSLVAPGTSGTLKYDWVSGKIQLTSGNVTYTTDQGNGCRYTDMTLATGLRAPEIAQMLLIYPDEPGKDYGGDYHWLNTRGERLPLCGGGWGDGAHAGVFSVSLHNPRSHVYWPIGFRSAYVEL